MTRIDTDVLIDTDKYLHVKRFRNPVSQQISVTVSVHYRSSAATRDFTNFITATANTTNYCSYTSNMTENDKLYDDAEAYWKTVPATVGGMLGGYGHISSTDVVGSKKFIRRFLNVN